MKYYIINISYLKLIFILFIILLLIGCGGSSTQSTSNLDENEVRKGIAFSIATQLKTDPALVAEAAVLTELINSKKSFDASSVRAEFDDARQDFQEWSKIVRASNLEKQVKAFTFINKHLNNSVIDSPNIVLKAMNNVFVINGEKTVFNQSEVSPNSAWEEISSNNTLKIYEKLHATLEKNVDKQNFVDKVFRFKVSTSIEELSENECKDDEWCIIAKKPLTKDQIEYFNDQIDKSFEKLRDIAKACADGDDSCAKEDPNLSDSKKLIAIVNYTTKGLKFLGAIDEDQVKKTQVVAEGLGSIYVNSAKINDIISKADPGKIWDYVTELSEWKNFIFGNETSSDFDSTIKNIGSIVEAVSSIEGSVRAIIKIFSGSTSETMDAKILSEIKQLQSMIVDLRKNINARFDVVDFKLDSLMIAMTTGLDTVNSNVLDIGERIDTANKALSDISVILNKIESNVLHAINDLAKQNLTNITSLEVQDTTQAKFEEDLVLLYNWSYVASADCTQTSCAAIDLNDGLYNALSEQSNGYLLNIYNKLSNYFTGSFISANQLANPDSLSYSLRMYLDILRRFPDKSKTSSQMIQRELRTILNERIIPITNFISQLQKSNTLISALFENYINKSVELENAIKNATPLYLRSQSPIGYDYSYLSLWGSEEQETNYTPKFVINNKIYPYSDTNGSPLTVPKSWELLVDQVSINAEILGIQTILAYYSLPTDNYGWGVIFNEKIKENRYWSWSGIDLTISTFYGNSKIKSRLLMAPDAENRGYINKEREGICYYFTLDNISIAPSAVPAASVVSAAWETGSKFIGNGWCSDCGYVPQNLSDLFSTTAYQTYDWSDTTLKANIKSSIRSKLSTLRQGFYSKIANDIVLKVDNVGSAAKHLDGARLALQKALEIGFSKAMRDNLLWRAGFFGAKALPDSTSIATMIAMADEKDEQFVDFVNLSKTRANILYEIVQAEIERVAAGNAKYTNSEIENLRAELELQLSIAIKNSNTNN